MKYIKDVLNLYSEEFIRKFYSYHSTKQSSVYFELSVDSFKKLLNQLGIEQHTKAENARLTNIEKYGVDNPSKSVEVKDKIKKTKLDRYGDENYNNIDKIRDTCLDKYGTVTASGSEQVKNKVKETFIKNYGVSNIFKKVDYIKECQSNKYDGLDNFYRMNQQKRENSLIEKYGVNNISQINGSRDKAKESMRTTCLERYGVEFPVLLPQCNVKGHGGNSKPNQNFERLLVENNFEYVREFPIKNKRYDFKVGNNLIEIDPTITHNSTWSPYGTPVGRRYHYEKSSLARENNMRCIHVFDWDNINKVLNLLKNTDEKIYARKCTIKEVDISTASSFINEHHLQGYIKDKIRIGLFYNNELVSVMTFGKPRYNKKYEYELIRYCSCKRVVGGANKLFKYFTKMYNPISVVSYCDLSKFDGHTYTNIGFKLESVKIGKHWYRQTDGKHILDTSLNKIGFDKLFNTDYGKGTSNTDLMIQEGFVEIFDSGQARYGWYPVCV